MYSLYFRLWKTHKHRTLVRCSNPKKGHGLALYLTLGFITVVLAAGLYYYWQYQQVSDLRKQNESLASQLASLQNASKPTQPSGGSTSTTISYKARIGKFTLTLPDKYVVIQQNDGGGEGGDFTAVLVGDKTAKQGVVTSSIGSSVEISARKLRGQSFRSQVDADLKNKGPFDKSLVQIDGVSAESYKVGGLADPKIVYFSKGDVFYQIALDSMDLSNAKLDVVIAGFKFD